MSTLLQINASLFSDHGQSSQLANTFVSSWLDNHPGTRLVKRDLASDPVPHLDAARFGAFTTPPDARNEAQRAVVAYSDALIDELRQADTIVLGLPMYNFGLPSSLKAYIDHIARAGVTFRYTENGPVGLLENKKVFVLAARGGIYSGTPRDTQTTYVRDILGFMGLKDIEFVYAEGLAISEENKAASLAKARDAIAGIAA